MSRNLQALNATNYLNDNMNKIIDAFVMYYGEDKREEIISKFSKMLLITYQSPSTIQSIVYNEKKEISTQLFELAIEKSGVEKELYDSVFKTFNTTLDDIKYSDLSLAYEFVSKYNSVMTYENDYKFENFINIIKKIYPNVDKDNIYEYLKNGKLDFIKKLNIAIEEAKLDYDKYVNENLKETLELNEGFEKKFKKIKQDGYINLIEKYKNLLNEQDQTKFESKKNATYFSSYDIPGIEIIFGGSLQTNSCLDYFDDESEKRLEDKESSKYLKDTIKNNRIKYFKYKGFDLGDNYDDYINNKDVQQILPSKEFIKEIKNEKDKILNDINIKYYSSIPLYQETMKKIDDLNLLDKDISFNPEAYTTKLTCLNPNIIKTENGYDLYSLMLIYSGVSEYDDVRIIHEFNHLFELSLLNVGEQKYQMITGWDIIDSNINNSLQEIDTVNQDKNKREYELFSEIINELIAQEITEKMHSNDIYLLNTKEDTKIKGGSSYENFISLVREFYNVYKEEIIESRRNNNIQIIFDKVGKENFDKLNELFHEFYNHFSGWEYYNLSTDIHNKKNTERVRKYVDIINARDEILKNMKLYSEQNVVTNQI